MFLRCAAFRADAFAARFLGGEIGGDAPAQGEPDKQQLAYGIGPAAKRRAHPWPAFSN
jgi:hypothetical protein